MSDPSLSTSAPARFPTTAWSFIAAIHDRPAPDRKVALNQFIQAYWKPVFCFLRARGYPLHRAEDLTQEFFLRLLEKDWIERADPRRGRFRTFLLTVLVRFLADQGPGRAARQEVFEGGLGSVESLIRDADRAYEPPTSETAEEVFMKQWAAALVESALERLREQCRQEGNDHWYAVFAAIHFSAAQEMRATQESLADKFGITRDQVRYGLEQAQTRFRALLRSEVRDQVGSEAEIDEEVGELLALLGN